MPSRKFYQPLNEHDQLPFRFEQRYVPKKEDGWPDWDVEILQDVPVIDTVECSGEWLYDVCVRELDPRTMSDMKAVKACAQETRTCQVGADVPDLVTDGWIQIRGCGVGGCTDWSNATTVPEPGFGLMILVGTLLIGALYERSRERRRIRAVHGVRFQGQRQAIRRWVRKMLWRWL
jgi:hypothetical protein